MAEGTTRLATDNVLRAAERLAVALVDQCTGLAGPNKPVLPIAPTSFNNYVSGSVRRHIGQPFGSSGVDNAPEQPGLVQDGDPTTEAGTARLALRRGSFVFPLHSLSLDATSRSQTVTNSTTAVQNIRYAPTASTS